jgi:uncharacterized membrane protein
MTEFPFPPAILWVCIGLFIILVAVDSRRRAFNKILEAERDRRDAITALGMQVVSVVILVASLFVILSQRYTTADAHWAYAMVGTVIGFWLKK